MEFELISVKINVGLSAFFSGIDNVFSIGWTFVLSFDYSFYYFEISFSSYSLFINLGENFFSEIWSSFLALTIKPIKAPV